MLYILFFAACLLCFLCLHLGKEADEDAAEDACTEGTEEHGYLAA